MSRVRGIEVGLAAAVALAVIGFVTGVTTTGHEVSAYVSVRPVPRPEVAARGYADMRTRSYGPNAEAQARWFGALATGPAISEPVVQSEADRAAALARRAERRAYDGAPPTIPHEIDQLAVPSCLACHAEGKVIAGMVAPRMSHARHDSCVQCHVVAADPRRVAQTPPAPETVFVGLESVRGGERAWPGAPPTIPHSTRMRERCDACHGTLGALGMRSTHPWRQSCVQCHAPSAALDQRTTTSRSP